MLLGGGNNCTYFWSFLNRTETWKHERQVFKNNENNAVLQSKIKQKSLFQIRWVDLLIMKCIKKADIEKTASTM